jgi:plasmid maintenance system antidote protein VapI
LRPVILATQEAEIRRTAGQSQPGEIVHETLSRKYPSQKGLAERLKVKALSSNPTTAKQTNKKLS